jgi:predicted nucleic acid-binding Zn ribbon protein
MNHQTIRDCIQQFFAQRGKISLLLEQKAVELWAEEVGVFIAKHTTKVTARQGALYVTIPNAALRFEVMGSRSQIIAKINKKLGYEVIKAIIVN